MEYEGENTRIQNIIYEKKKKNSKPLGGGGEAWGQCSWH